MRRLDANLRPEASCVRLVPLSLAAAVALYSSYRTSRIIKSGFDINRRCRDKLSPKTEIVYHHPVIALDLPHIIKGLDSASLYISDTGPS